METKNTSHDVRPTTTKMGYASGKSKIHKQTSEPRVLNKTIK